jgi:hypothetical protein
MKPTVRRSVRPLRRLLEKENPNEHVKSRIEQSIQLLSNRQPTPSTTSLTYHETHNRIPADLPIVVVA